MRECKNPVQFWASKASLFVLCTVPGLTTHPIAVDISPSLRLAWGQWAAKLDAYGPFEQITIAAAVQKLGYQPDIQLILTKAREAQRHGEG